MVVDPISPSRFRSALSLNSTFSTLRSALNVDDSFIKNISASFAPDETPAGDEPFDPALNVDNPALGVLGNAFNGSRLSGIPLHISGGSVTFRTESGTEKHVAAPFQSVSVRKSSENNLTVFNETTGEAIRLEKGEALEVTGDGQAELVARDGDKLRLESGEAVTLTEKDGVLKLNVSTFRNTLELSEKSEPLGVTGNSGTSITLFTDPNNSLQFNAGQEARLVPLPTVI
ncbi:MAG: hypothetical protein ABEK50_08550 [bacterium]